MTDKPVYRWEIRRAAKTRRNKHISSISTHDLVMLIVIMAMLILVLRIIFIFGSVQGMNIGPFTAHEALREHTDVPLADMYLVAESSHMLKFISLASFIYWVSASWKSLASRSVSLTTKLFKLTIGLTILILLFASFLPDHAVYFANIWFEPASRPQQKITI